ncbi:MAG TPA: hypothetical protein PK843_15695 [bacterium]|nr:hypothetical protein [bacterium]HPN35958.1 hypothetical protein [bacterium]
MATPKKSNVSSETADQETSCLLLARELASLRGQFHDITTRYQANVEATLVACVNSLSAKDSEDLLCGKKSRREWQTLIKAVQEIKLKPQKGRLKDIRRIDALVSEIAEQLGLS